MLVKFKEWNTQLFRNDMFYDRRMVELLLISGLGSERIANGDVSRKYLKFISGKLDAYFMFVHRKNLKYHRLYILLAVFLCERVHGEDRRLVKLDEYVADFIKQKRKCSKRQK